MRYEELLEAIKNFGDSQGPYDFNGMVHLLLASLDNLRENALEAELEDMHGAFTDDQIRFWHKLTAYLPDLQ